MPAAFRSALPALAVTMALVLCAGAAPVQANVVNKVVAVVNGEVVTLYDLKTRLDMRSGAPAVPGEPIEGSPDQGAMRRKVLRAMINDMLLLQEAERLGIEAGEDIVEERIERIKEEQGLTDKEFDRVLEQNGLTRSEYVQRVREEVKKNRLLQAMVREKVLVTAEEIRSFYQEHKEAFRVPEKMHLKVLVLDDRGRLAGIRERIAGGNLDFGTAAARYSQGPAASQGGDLGFVRWQDLQARWRNALQGMEPGQLSPVFKFGEGYAVLQLAGIQPGAARPLEEVRDRIRERLFAEKLRSRYDEYIRELRSKAVIDVRL